MKIVDFENVNTTISNDLSVINEKSLSQKADSIYKQLVDEGCSAKDIIAISNHLLSSLTNDLRVKQTETNVSMHNI